MRRVVTIVMAVNLGYFRIECTVASVIGSVSLFADSIDFLEDTAVNAMILILPAAAVSAGTGTASAVAGGL